jgi:hypothetical protein
MGFAFLSLKAPLENFYSIWCDTIVPSHSTCTMNDTYIHVCPQISPIILGLKN